MPNIKLYNGDCLEVLKNVPDNSIDLILCDLPYAETGNKWDKLIDLKELFNQYERVIKETGAIVLTGTFKFGVTLYNTALTYISMIGYGKKITVLTPQMLTINHLEYMKWFLCLEKVELLMELEFR